MKKRRLKGMNRMLAGGLCAVLAAAQAVLPVNPVYAAPEDGAETVVISSVEDFAAFVDDCRDAAWSVDKVVTLEADLSFSDKKFVSVPYFAGEFDGNGHTVSGIEITDNVSRSGMFAETAKTANIHDLEVRGIVRPGGSQDMVGGIAGENRGRIAGCTFSGIVTADTRAGGITGSNAKGGRVLDCKVYGMIEGTLMVGGIAGESEGAIRRCSNQASVNVSEQEETITSDRLTALVEYVTTTGDLNSMRSNGNITDIGGIVGLSKGKVENCSNMGTVGYPYVGYNIGGITGRSSGFVSGCINSGAVRGRKDVGGIVGQLQPYLEVDFSQDDLARLQEELNRLNDMINTTADDARGVSTSTADSFEALSDLIGEAETQAKQMSDGALSYADALVDQSNLNLEIVQSAADDLSYIMSNLQNGVDGLREAGDTLADEAEKFADAVRLTDEDRQSMNDAIDTIQSGMTDIAASGSELSTEIAALSSDLEQLQNDYDASGWNAAKIIRYMGLIMDDAQAVNRDASAISASLNNDLIPSANGISRIVEKYTSAAADELPALRSALNGFNNAVTELSDSMAKVSQDVAEVVDALNDASQFADLIQALSESETLADDLRDMGDKLTALSEKTSELNTEINRFLETVEVSEEDRAALKTYQETMQNAMDDIANNGASLQSAVDTLMRDLDTVQSDLEASEPSFTAVEADIRRIGSDVRSAARVMTDIMAAVNEKLIPSFNTLTDLLQKYSDAADDRPLWAAVNKLQAAVDVMPDTFSDTSEMIDFLNEALDTVIPKIDGETRQSGEDLYAALLSASERMGAISRTLGDGSEVLTADIQRVSNQLNYCINIFIDAIQDSSTNLDPMDHIEDVSSGELSQEEINAVTSGRITNSQNAGELIGALNLGGIVGTVGIESDLDPEEDIKSKGGSASANYALQSRCIIDGCVNRGGVSSRRSYVGGIAGLMDMGLVYACENYGDLSSETGSYIGGLAGFSSSAVRGSYAKCALSGARYIGGVAGYGEILSDNVTMVRIPRAEQEYGAVAGAVSERSENYVYGNLFVAEDASFKDEALREDEISGAVSGLGGVSFSGMAREISYEELTQIDNLPAAFREIKLVFVADDTAVKVIDCNYGDAVADHEIPEIPEKEGYSAHWDRADFSEVRGDDVITAIYEVRITTIGSAAKRDGKQSVLLVSGDFGNESALHAEGVQAADGELERWHVTVDAAGAHEYRFLPENEGAEVALYIVQGGNRAKLVTDTFGKYLTFETDASEFDLIVESVQGTSRALWIIGIAAAAAVIAAQIWKKWRGRKAKKGERKK